MSTSTSSDENKIPGSPPEIPVNPNVKESNTEGGGTEGNLGVDNFMQAVELLKSIEDKLRLCLNNLNDDDKKEVEESGQHIRQKWYEYGYMARSIILAFERRMDDPALPETEKNVIKDLINRMESALTATAQLVEEKLNKV